jgi:hypothetical protein
VKGKLPAVTSASFIILAVLLTCRVEIDIKWSQVCRFCEEMDVKWWLISRYFKPRLKTTYKVCKVPGVLGLG